MGVKRRNEGREGKGGCREGEVKKGRKGRGPIFSIGVFDFPLICFWVCLIFFEFSSLPFDFPWLPLILLWLSLDFFDFSLIIVVKLDW